MSTLITIDIAHPPLHSDAAEAMLDKSLRDAQLSGTLRIINIIHGYGSQGKGAGVLKTLVKNWAYNNRQRIKATIGGEQISPFHPLTQSMVSSCGISFGDISSANQGTTILWVR